MAGDRSNRQDHEKIYVLAIGGFVVCVYVFSLAFMFWPLVKHHHLTFADSAPTTVIEATESGDDTLARLRDRVRRDTDKLMREY